MHSWMFLASYADLRRTLIANQTVSSMLHLGPRGFDSIGGEVVQTTAFVLQNCTTTSALGTYFRLVSGKSEEAKVKAFFDSKAGSIQGLIFKFNQVDYGRMPAAPFAYWITPRLLSVFASEKALSHFSSPMD